MRIECPVLILSIYDREAQNKFLDALPHTRENYGTLFLCRRDFQSAIFFSTGYNRFLTLKRRVSLRLIKNAKLVAICN